MGGVVNLHVLCVVLFVPDLICCFLLQSITGGNKNGIKTTHVTSRQVSMMQRGKETVGMCSSLCV